MRSSRESQERAPLPGSGYLEDYTAPFLVTAGVLCFMALITLWALFGLPFVLFAALAVDRVFLNR